MQADTDLILHIDTASDRGVVMLAAGDNIVALRVNHEPMNHASWVQPAIAAVLHEAGVKSTQLKAVAVANGPGSYTGLRVGLAAAKGFCFACNLPLITLCSLKIMAKAVCLTQQPQPAGNEHLPAIAALIDARRMEVFYAVFDREVSGVLEGPAAAEVSNEFLMNWYNNQGLICTGNGCAKWLNLLKQDAVTYVKLPPAELAFAKLANEAYNQLNFANLPYSEPFYIKSFYSTIKKP
jgi:tRNA threonylcarbamoyladenosine biosynthesis protein TsaB